MRLTNETMLKESVYSKENEVKNTITKCVYPRIETFRDEEVIEYRQYEITAEGKQVCNIIIEKRDDWSKALAMLEVERAEIFELLTKFDTKMLRVKELIART